MRHFPGAHFPRAHFPGAMIAIAVAIAAQSITAPALADTRTIEGSKLTLTLTGDDQTTIETDPGLTHGIRVVADALDCLAGPGGSGTGAGGEISLASAACGSDMGQLTIMVPASFPVTINSMGSGNVNVGELYGPLNVALNSDGDLNVKRAGTLRLAVRGSGDATVRAVAGAADVEIDGSGEVKLFRVDGILKVGQHGSGDLAIAHIESPLAEFEMASSGDTVVAGGHIATLRVRTAGSGDFAMAGAIDTADLQAVGGGDIRVPHIDGRVTRRAMGGSSIVIGGRNGLGGDAMRRLSESVSSADSDESDRGVHVSRSGHASGFGHFIAGIVVLGVLIAVWRTVSRNGGLAAVSRRFPAAGTPAAPSHPGVIALCDLLAGLERRLARVEIHVTSREFELNRKFRDIDAGTGGRS
jgi:hypothetical protein